MSLDEAQEALQSRLAGLHPEEIGGAVWRCLAGVVGAASAAKGAGDAASPALSSATSTPSKVHRSLVHELEGMQDQLNKSATAATSRPSSATVRVARGSLRALSPEEIARRQAKARHFSRGALTSLGTN